VPYYQITCDTTHVERILGNMLFQLKDFHNPMREEMLAWQTQDMHRKRPRAKFSMNHRRIGTRIYPRGRHHYRKRTDRQYPLRRRGHRHHTTTRPILRVELYERLRDRMTQLLGTIGWAA
jgi:hypothetical protein